MDLCLRPFLRRRGGPLGRRLPPTQPVVRAKQQHRIVCGLKKRFAAFPRCNRSQPPKRLSCWTRAALFKAIKRAHELKFKAPPSNSGASANTRRATTPRGWRAPSPAPPAASGRTSKRAATGSSPRRTAPAASRRASPSWPCPAATPSARTALEDWARGWSTRTRSTVVQSCEEAVGAPSDHAPWDEHCSCCCA